MQFVMSPHVLGMGECSSTDLASIPRKHNKIKILQTILNGSNFEPLNLH